MTGKIAIIGNGESALAFKAGGVDAFFADDEKEARELLKKLARTYKVIFVTEDLAEKMDDLITRMLACDSSRSVRQRRQRLRGGKNEAVCRKGFGRGRFVRKRKTL